jgi:hypothetical protein
LGEFSDINTRKDQSITVNIAQERRWQTADISLPLQQASPQPLFSNTNNVYWYNRKSRRNLHSKE